MEKGEDKGKLNENLTRAGNYDGNIHGWFEYNKSDIRGQSKPEDNNQKEVDSYMNMFLIESTKARIQETLSNESIEEMMYEEDCFWNMEEITDWNDEKF